MVQVAGRPRVFDRRATRLAWDLDRTPMGIRSASSVGELDGLMRALSLAVPVSALLWIGAGAILASAIR
ncbi:hypothetical protein [Sphingomonas sp.]|uniref:hypothetical protein n=1 Tax=Sphingomonas sp. TaxID=28214 RepID=UPI000DB437FC|nr:hypothetical protein [Sphingomonas sp.]PZU11879.1 MAG: hypothetical protein DI605_02700 [Sphingomonas sp.]